MPKAKNKSLRMKREARRRLYIAQKLKQQKELTEAFNLVNKWVDDVVSVHNWVENIVSGISVPPQNSSVPPQNSSHQDVSASSNWPDVSTAPEIDTNVYESPSLNKKAKLRLKYAEDPEYREQKRAKARAHYLKVEKYQCDICGEWFPLKSKLKVHKVLHENKHRCDICSKEFSEESELSVHKMVHSCEKYADNPEYREHKRTAARANYLKAKKYKCDICDEWFPLKSKLKVHKVVHENKPRCSICNKEFLDDLGLRVHMMVRENKHRCSICCEEFSEESDLRSHKVVHTGEKNYFCDVCGKGYFQPSSLKNHMRLHTVKKNYECKICGKKLVRQAGLTQHMLLHLDNRSYKCSVCDKIYYSAFQLQKHLEIHQRYEVQSEPVFESVFLINEESPVNDVFVIDEESPLIDVHENSDAIPYVLKPSSCDLTVACSVEEQNYDTSAEYAVEIKEEPVL